MKFFFLSLHKLFFLYCSALYLTSCSVGPSYKSPSVEIPSDWKNKNEECKTTFLEQNGKLVELDYWWQIFNDPKLEELESLALENNRDLFIALERTKEARALMGIAASQFYPQIYLSPQYTNTLELVKNYTNPQNKTLAQLTKGQTDLPFRAHELFYYMPLNLSYEVDLWGKIRDRYDEAKYTWEAQKKNYEAVMLSLTASLATAFYQLRAIDAQIDLLLNVLKTRQKAYQINKDRYEEQITFYADVMLAKEEVDSALIQYQENLRQRSVLEDQIAVLIGIPASEFSLEHMPLQELPPCIPSGLPSEVLLRRPDIAEAEFNARSRQASVKESYSLFFPSLTLTSGIGFESPVLKDFLKWISRYLMGGAQANQLIFDGFKTPYNLDLQIARFKEGGAEYQQQVLIAFQEVEDALTDLESYAKQYDLAISTAHAAQITYNLYRDRYTSGIIYYIDVANTERDLLNYQIAVNNYLGYRYISTIQFIKALGGGWSNGT